MKYKTMLFLSLGAILLNSHQGFAHTKYVVIEQPTTTVVVAEQPATSVVMVEQEPPALIVETQGSCPGVGYVWIPGYWKWNGSWVWKQGRWDVKPHGQAVWVAGVWEKRHHHWVWREGYWR